MSTKKLILSGLIKFQIMEMEWDEAEEEDIRYFNMKYCVNKRICVENYIQKTIPRYTDFDFKSHFRLSRETFTLVLSHISPSYSSVGKPTSPSIQLLVALWFLGNQEVFRKIADRFNISQSTAHAYIYNVLNILIEKRELFIKWPSRYYAQEISSYFERKNKFPGIVGCIDGSHIPITTPSVSQESYVNRKGYHSLLLQGVCDHQSKFIHVSCGWPGSMHDVRMLRKSDLGQNLFNNPHDLLHSNDTHLIGDSAYPLHKHLLTPYRDNGHLNAVEKNYNYKLSENRIKIEHTFGLLKGRFRCLLHLNVYKTQHIPKIILGCCILHNICLDANDCMEAKCESTDTPGNDSIYEGSDTGYTKRDYIASLLSVL